MKVGFVFLFQNNASSCLKSCAFLAQVQNFSSILAGDGSLPPTPGIPTVTSRNFTSISLKWDPVQIMTGAVVYLIEITITGEQSGIHPKYLSEVSCTQVYSTGLSLSYFGSGCTTRLHYLLSFSFFLFFFLAVSIFAFVSELWYFLCFTFSILFVFAFQFCIIDSFLSYLT